VVSTDMSSHLVEPVDGVAVGSTVINTGTARVVDQRPQHVAGFGPLLASRVGT